MAYVDDAPVSMTFGFPWGPVGWIGSVLTLEEHRGQGLGQAVVEDSIEALRAHGCETIKLYATPKAISLYERIGFTGETEYVISSGGHRAGRTPQTEPLAGHLDAALALDRDVFPGDRTAWIEQIAEANPETSIAVVEEGELAGYGIARPGPNVTEIGPVLVREGSAGVAQRLVDGLLGRVPEDRPVGLIYPKSSWAASSTWSCRGFVVTDTPLEMRLGPPVEEDRDAIVAAGGQEVG